MNQDSKKLSGSTLKIIAMVTMLIDHIGAVMIEKGILKCRDYAGYGDHIKLIKELDTITRLIGRIAFPIFCFLLVEGFVHTRSRGKYLLRLFILALISEVPFDLAFRLSYYNMTLQNVCFTLFLGVLMLTFWEIIIQKPVEDPWECFIKAELFRKVLAIYVVLLTMIFAAVFKVDYEALGIALIFAFYIFRKQLFKRNVTASMILLCGKPLEVFGITALIPIQEYNGERGLKLKYLFYDFYPVHIMLLVLLRKLVLGIGF